MADTKYGTMENFLGCDQKGIRAHMPPLTDSHSGKGRRKGIYPPSAFLYDPVEDTRGPVGSVLVIHTFRTPVGSG
ncbi:MAG: hypothetical protein P1S59_06635 [bacterium]|nr:hypothetical protein [bacterium]